ncbi:MAG: hypothetical protein ACRDGS_01415, partial [Chloroflexota bacterium]
ASTSASSPSAVSRPSVRQVLTTLGYRRDAPPGDYTLRTIRFQSHRYGALIRVRGGVSRPRIDGMVVAVKGHSRWVRGLFYRDPQRPSYGGIIYDAIYDDSHRRQGFTNAMRGPTLFYKALERAIARQKHISIRALGPYLHSRGYVVSGLILPTTRSGNAAYSVLQPSAPVTIDLRLPITVTVRSNGPQGDEGLPLRSIPSRNILTLGGPSVHNAWYVMHRQLHFVTYEYLKGHPILIRVRSGGESAYLFLMCELLAHMSRAFHDRHKVTGNFIQRLMGKTDNQYQPGNTIIPQGWFIQMGPSGSQGVLVGPI